MRSKGKKNRKGRGAYRRSEKVVVFLRTGTLCLLGVVVVTLTVLALRSLEDRFVMHEVIVTGNYHLDEKEIISSASVDRNDTLLKLDLDVIHERLRKNAWIKNVSLRRQFPGTLLVRIEEAEPEALLSHKKRVYLMDEEGAILERLKGDGTPFLPVIRGINPNNRDGVREALKLIEALDKKNILDSAGSVEIGMESYGMTARLDGELIKVGYGNYIEKFGRWLELEPEIRRKGVSIQYVDLRFKDSVIVKPEETGEAKKTS